METTRNFIEGLKLAHKEAASQGRVTAKEEEALQKLLELPNSNIWKRRVHWRVRRAYVKSVGKAVAVNLDWTTLVEWLKEHWDDVLKIIMSIIPFLI